MNTVDTQYETPAEITGGRPASSRLSMTMFILEKQYDRIKTVRAVRASFVVT